MRSDRSAFKNDKKLQDGLQARLKQLRKEGGNAKCADCDDGDTRFASISLGTFICNRCFGLHRALGTHLTKTRVLNLDAWTEEEVDKLASIGNKRANAYFLAKLPRHINPPSPDSSDRVVERFLREKYEQRKYCAEGLPLWEQRNQHAPSTERMHDSIANKKSENAPKELPAPVSSNLLAFPDDDWDPFGLSSPSLGKDGQKAAVAKVLDATTAVPWPQQWPAIEKNDANVSNWPTHSSSRSPWEDCASQVKTPISPLNPWASDLQKAPASTSAPCSSGHNWQFPQWPSPQSSGTFGQGGYKNSFAESPLAPGGIHAHGKPNPWQLEAPKNTPSSWASDFDPLWK